MFYPIKIQKINENTQIEFGYDPLRPTKEKIIQIYNECLSEAKKRNILVEYHTNKTSYSIRQTLEMIIRASVPESSQLVREVETKIIKKERG